MTVGEVTEDLIRIKKNYNVFYPDDCAVNLACNVLERLPREMTIFETMRKLEELRQEGKL